MQYSVDWLEMDDDEIYYRFWQIEKATATVLISHGMAEHSERYERLAQSMNQAGLNVIAWDHPGHGEHSLQLGQLSGNWQQLIKRIDPIIDLAKSYSQAPIFLMGHSMGSYVALSYCLSQHKEACPIDGLILQGSGLRAPWVTLLARWVNRALMAGFGGKDQSDFFDWLTLGRFNRAFQPNQSHCDWISSQPKAIIDYIADPLCGFICSNAYWQELLRFFGQFEQQLHQRPLDMPICFMYGQDDPVGEFGHGIERLQQRIQHYNPSISIEQFCYPNARHEIHHDHCQQQAASDLVTWIQQQL